MRQSTPILIVLLGASVIGNVLLASRLSRKAEPDPAAVRPAAAPERSPRPDDAASLRDSLQAEKRKNEELRARIERLETDKKVLAQDVPVTPGRAEKLEAFRAKLRKLMKLMKDPAAQAGAVDPDNMVELTEVMMEFYKLAATRAKDPKTYADYLQAFYEVGLEGEGTALSAEQSQAIQRLLQDLGDGLSKIPPAPAGDRLIREIELESAVGEKLKALLTQAQRDAISKGEMSAMMMGNMMSTSYVQKQGGAEQIAQMWTAAYQLDPAQQPQVKAAAQSYLDAMSRYEATQKKPFSFDQPGSPEATQRRLQSVREQISALTVLQGSLTPAQQERIRTQTMREFILFDAQAMQAGVEAQRVEAPKDK